MLTINCKDTDGKLIAYDWHVGSEFPKDIFSGLHRVVNIQADGYELDYIVYSLWPGTFFMLRNST
jgi:hypothetical protein